MHYVHLTAMKSNKTKGKMCPPLPLFSLNITRKTGKTGKTGRKPKSRHVQKHKRKKLQRKWRSGACRMSSGSRLRWK